jgi:predicted NBD/HSP70 family sugar kinase
VLYEVRPDAGFVLALDVGRQYLRGAVANLRGEVLARDSTRARASTAAGTIRELTTLADSLTAAAGLRRKDLTQTVVGIPGVYDPARDRLTLIGSLVGWDKPGALTALRTEFGPDLMIENDVDLGALAELAHGHGGGVASFAFVSVGTGVGMGLVIDGRLRRGAHGVTGEIGFLPFAEGHGVDPKDARRRGPFESAASAASVVRSARRGGMRGSVTARRVFEAAAAGDAVAKAVVVEEALLVAKAMCTVITVVDPELIVLGGGIGQAPGFLAAVTRELAAIAPVMPDVRVSDLATDVIVEGCLVAGIDRAWEIVVPTDGSVEAGMRP